MPESHVVWHGGVNTPWRGYLDTEAFPTRAPQPLIIVRQVDTLTDEDGPGARQLTRRTFAARVDKARGLMARPQTISELMEALHATKFNVWVVLKALRLEGLQSERVRQPHARPVTRYWLEKV